MVLDFLEHLRAESARFADALAGADPDAPVPTCPGWTADDLLWHLGEVQHFWGRIVASRLTDLDGYDGPARPDGHSALLEFFRTTSAALIDALAATDDEVTVWTWLDSDQSVGFVRRRQAHEALIHRLDAESVAGPIGTVDPALATDGVLEALEWMFGGAPAWATSTIDGPVGRIATTDTGAVWLVRMGRWSGTSPNTGTSYDDEAAVFLVDARLDAAPAFELSGRAGDLDGWIWNRPHRGAVTLTGDTTAFETIVRTGVQ